MTTETTKATYRITDGNAIETRTAESAVEEIRGWWPLALESDSDEDTVARVTEAVEAVEEPAEITAESLQAYADSVSSAAAEAIGSESVDGHGNYHVTAASAAGMSLTVTAIEAETDAPTIAEQASSQMGGDGSRFVARDGRSLQQICRALRAEVHRRQDGARRYAFSDGSAIIHEAPAWDLMHADCECGWCWDGGGRDASDLQCDEVEEYRLNGATMDAEDAGHDEEHISEARSDAEDAAAGHLKAIEWEPEQGTDDAALGLEEDWGGGPDWMGGREWADFCRAAVRAEAARRIAAGE